MALSSRAFFSAFISEFKKSGRKINWVNLGDTIWTNKMLGTGKTRKKDDYGVIGRLGQKYGYIIQAEWMRLDQIWYNDLEENVDWDFTPWKTDVVIEHENSIDRFVYTVMKMGEVSAPLKVGIFYPDEEDENELIQTASEIIVKQAASYPGGVYLIIFGFIDESIKWHAFEIDWKGNMFPIHTYFE